MTVTEEQIVCILIIFHQKCYMKLCICACVPFHAGSGDKLVPYLFHFVQLNYIHVCIFIYIILINNISYTYSILPIHKMGYIRKNWTFD